MRQVTQKPPNALALGEDHSMRCPQLGIIFLSWDDLPHKLHGMICHLAALIEFSSKCEKNGRRPNLVTTRLGQAVSQASYAKASSAASTPDVAAQPC